MEVRGRDFMMVPESEVFTKKDEKRRKPHRVQSKKNLAYCF